MMLTGAQILIRKLRQHKVKIIFEFPGGSICPILDELLRHKEIRLICFRHEQAAIHAADAYARLKGVAGVCMATSGPGASNLVTGIANAYMDSVPLVIITGQVAAWDLKKDRLVRQRGFQELDIISVVKSITKAAFLVDDLSSLAMIIDKAFFIAQDGRPGPVLIDIPINVQYTRGEFSNRPLKLKKKKMTCSDGVVKNIVGHFLAAGKPLILAGGGVGLANAQRELMQLVKTYKLPVAQTLMGLTAVTSDYKLNLGLVGYAGNKVNDSVLRDADFVLGIGLRFDNRAFPEANKEFNQGAYLAHVDIDCHELNHRVAVNQAILSDARYFLKAFLAQLKKSGAKPKREWAHQVHGLKKAHFFKARSSLKPQFILERLSALCKDKDVILTTDVGQHQLWTAQHFRFSKPQTLVTSGGLGTMGFGLPAAIGAKIAFAKSNVIAITSDGSLQMNIQELATISDLSLAIKILVFNNKCLGLVRQIQEFAFSGRYISTCVNSQVDFVKIAKAYRIEALSVKKASQIEAALKKMIGSPASLLVNIEIPERENVFPIKVKGKKIYNGR